MNIFIRSIQVILGIIALNGIYGLVLHVMLAWTRRLSLGEIAGTITTVLMLGLIIFLLQRYYDIRNRQIVTSTGKFFGVALTGASITAFIAISVIIIIFAVAFSN